MNHAGLVHISLVLFFFLIVCLGNYLHAGIASIHNTVHLRSSRCSRIQLTKRVTRTTVDVSLWEACGLNNSSWDGQHENEGEDVHGRY